MDTFFDDIFELGFEYSFEFEYPCGNSMTDDEWNYASENPVNYGDQVREVSSCDSRETVTLQPESNQVKNKPRRVPLQEISPKPNVIDLTVEEVDLSSTDKENTVVISKERHLINRYHHDVKMYLLGGGDPDYIFEKEVPFLRDYIPRFRGMNLLQTCINDYTMCKLLVTYGADILSCDKRGVCTIDYCHNKRVKTYIDSIIN